LTSDDLLERLSSGLPSNRMRAAQEVLEGSPDPSLRPVLVEALTREEVPRIRQVLASAIEALGAAAHAPPSPTAQAEERSVDKAADILDELAGMIRHETQPAIGWVRLAASRELSDFDASATNAAIEALRRRVDGLATLTAAHRLPIRRLVSLSELISERVQGEHPGSLFAIERFDEVEDEIFTDPGLFELLVSNALQNAVDASRDIPRENAQIVIATGVSDRRFWVTITNRFLGATFDYSSVAATGRTSKKGHRGLGTRVMELAASRLGYEFELRAVGGTATFSLRGDRYV
jgi:signal transduction histidine kinase